MSRPSTIKRLPPEIKAEIHRLLEQGTPIHEIRTSLQNLGTNPPSSSAIGRYKQVFDRQMQHLRAANEMASTWAKTLRDDPESDAARLAMQLLEALAMRISAQGMEGGQDLSIKDVTMLAGAVRDLATTRRSMVDTADKIRNQILKEAGEKMEKVIQSQGLSTDIAAAIREAMTT
ncbi:MAG: DUF3486 family protein [Magnetococcales bacterium]|nr:DUF3486 family protein [Magnetococcales bacterium]